MSSIRRLKNGRYQADVQDRFRGIPRTKRTFDKKKDAEDWIEAVNREGTARLLGHSRRRLFGEALARYLREESPKKASAQDDAGNARTLRWPIWDPETRRWLRLEETPIEDVPAVLAKWSADLRAVRRRAYVGNYSGKEEARVWRTYHLREDTAGELVWYCQSDPEQAGDKVPFRVRVTDATLLAVLNKPRGAGRGRTGSESTTGRGPFSTGTLRARQQLVRRILGVAWKNWSTPGDVWIEQNIAEKIQLDAKSLPRDQWLTGYNMLDALASAALLVAPPPACFAEAIQAAGWCGWRESNLLLLEWPRVVFPVYQDNGRGELEEVQHGYFWVERKNVKGQKKPIVYPMIPELEQLFRRLWERRVVWQDNGGESHTYVFHRGDGKPIIGPGKGNTRLFRRLWTQTKRRAGVDPSFTWHALRHTWASWKLQEGKDRKLVAQLGGWTSTKMLDEVYAHFANKHLREAAQLPPARTAAVPVQSLDDSPKLPN